MNTMNEMGLFINAGEHFEKGKRQNRLNEENIQSIVETYKYRKETERYSRKVSMQEIEKNGYNLNISRYVSTALEEEKIDLNEVHKRLDSINKRIKENRDKHNAYLKELGLDEIE
ncbi:MAG: SAM-dependent methyltransferase [Bacteroidales bacterium]|nr:SAM-dependent methyltransferase [Bacteroidales bacterium]MCF8351288.1 SAM-dependent methyltransferase [Bacteroidales bacterium]MCF8377589.1 SAM-dependent methyltransferase [Bacteroidales bacterium]MCF8401830.1 SAM-dependent methyltransferase [Bacteroidales bacterium]